MHNYQFTSFKIKMSDPPFCKKREEVIEPMSNVQRLLMLARFWQARGD